MTRTDFRSVDDYIAAQPETSRALLRDVRAILRAALPGATEVISYQIPTYRMASGAVIHFAGWKRHWSLYPAPKGLADRMGDQGAPCRIENGTVRFPLASPVPADLVKEIVGMRLSEMLAASTAKARAR